MEMGLRKPQALQDPQPQPKMAATSIVDTAEEQETIRQVDEVLRQVRDMIQDDLIKPEKAKQLRLDAIKQLKSTTTDVKTTILVVKEYVGRNLLPEEDFNEAKDILADVIADPNYQARVTKKENIKKKIEMEREQQSANVSRRQQFDTLVAKDSAFGNTLIQYQQANRDVWRYDESKQAVEKDLQELKRQMKRCCYFCWPFGGCNRCLPCSFGDKSLDERRKGCTCMSGLWLFMPPFIPVIIFLMPFWIIQRITQCRMISRRNHLQQSLQTVQYEMQRLNTDIANLRNSDLLRDWLDLIDAMMVEEKNAFIMETVKRAALASV